MTMGYPTPPRSSPTDRGNECTGRPSVWKLRFAPFAVLAFTVLLLCGCGKDAPIGHVGEDGALDEESGSDLRALFPDSSLASSIREAIEGGATGLDSLSALVAKGRGIENLAGIGTLTHLEVLDLSDNRIIDLAPLSSLKNLRFLDLANNRVEDVASLGSMHSLEVLLLEQNGVLRNLDTLLSVTTLESVTISESGLTERGASTVEQLRTGGVAVEILRSFSGSDTTGVDDLLAEPCEDVVESIPGTFYVGDLDQLDGRECFELTSNIIVSDSDLVHLAIDGLVRTESLEIGGNDTLETVDLRQLVEVRRNFLVLENPHLVSLRLSKLQSVGRHLWINSNQRLVSLEGLEGLESVGDWLQIALNERLVSLEGLENLKRVGGTLHIEGNAVLRTLDGLEGLEDVEGDITIKDNPQLPSDMAMTFVERLRTLGFLGNVLVEGNGP